MKQITREELLKKVVGGDGMPFTPENFKTLISKMDEGNVMRHYDFVMYLKDRLPSPIELYLDILQEKLNEFGIVMKEGKFFRNGNEIDYWGLH